MKKVVSIVFVIILLAQTAQAKEERITFYIKYGFAKGGEVEVSVTDTTFDGKPAIQYVVDGRTTGVTNAIYRIRDIYETTVDANTYLPLKAIRNIKEGNYRRYNETLFHHDIDSLYSQRSGWHAMPKNMVDVLSGLYYFLNKNPFTDLHAGDAVKYLVYHAEKIEPVTIKFLREEVIETDIGQINCFVLTPLIIPGKIFKRPDAVKIYISKETQSMVYVELDTTFGAIKGIMRKYSIDGVDQIIQ